MGRVDGRTEGDSVVVLVIVGRTDGASMEGKEVGGHPFRGHSWKTDGSRPTMLVGPLQKRQFNDVQLKNVCLSNRVTDDGTTTCFSCEHCANAEDPMAPTEGGKVRVDNERQL